MANYSNYRNTHTHSGLTPTTQPLKGLEDVQVENSEGHYVFSVTPETLLIRFLVLGTTSPTFYQNPQDPQSMDFCGFDSAAFKVMYDFLNN